MSASYPSSAAGDAQLSIAVNSLQTTLATTVNSAVTSVVLTSATGFPSTGYVTIDSEVISYTGISTNTLTGCTRGADGTTAASHTSGVPVSATIVAAHHNSLKDEVEAVETDLVAAFASITPSTTNAVDTNITNRIKSLANQIKVGFGLTNWYDTISATFLKADLSNIGTVANDLPMNSHKVTGLAAATGNGDALRYEQLIGLYLLLTGGTLSGALAMGTNKITGLGNGTAAQDAAAFGQLKYFQTVQATGTSTTSTSSASFVDTVVSGTITPSNSSHRVKITISTSLRNAGRAHWGIGRGGSNISSQGEANVPTTGEASLCFSYIDSPASTSALTYTLQVLQETSGTIDINVNGLTWCIILEEIA